MTDKAQGTSGGTSGGEGGFVIRLYIARALNGFGLIILLALALRGLGAADQDQFSILFSFVLLMSAGAPLGGNLALVRNSVPRDSDPAAFALRLRAMWRGQALALAIHGLITGPVAVFVLGASPVTAAGMMVLGAAFSCRLIVVDFLRSCGFVMASQYLGALVYLIGAAALGAVTLLAQGPLTLAGIAVILGGSAGLAAAPLPFVAARTVGLARGMRGIAGPDAAALARPSVVFLAAVLLTEYFRDICVLLYTALADSTAGVADLGMAFRFLLVVSLPIALIDLLAAPYASIQSGAGFGASRAREAAALRRRYGLLMGIAVGGGVVFMLVAGPLLTLLLGTGMSSAPGSMAAGLSDQVLWVFLIVAVGRIFAAFFGPNVMALFFSGNNGAAMGITLFQIGLCALVIVMFSDQIGVFSAAWAFACSVVVSNVAALFLCRRRGIETVNVAALLRRG